MQRLARRGKVAAMPVLPRSADLMIAVPLALSSVLLARPPAEATLLEVALDLAELAVDGDETAVTWAGAALEAPTEARATTLWQESPFPFTALGSRWGLAGAGRMELELQVDARPGTWYPIPADPHAQSSAPFPEGTGHRAHGDQFGALLLLGAERADAWRLRVRMVPAGAPLRLERLTLVFIDASESAAAEPQQRFDDAYPKPPVYSRAQWGADPPQCSSGYCPVTHLGTHHTASPGAYDSQGFDDCASNLRGIQDYHMYSRGWCDIGYNYLTCKHGKVWEGRAGGDDVRGAHDGYNCGSMGVGALGYFHTPYNDIPTLALLDAYAELYAWKADQKGIDPFGRDYYVGYGAPMDNIYGHRDVSSTACPGDLLYSELGALRQEVDDRLSGATDRWIYDNPTARTRGSWTLGNSAPGRYGDDYLFAGTEPGGAALCYWSHAITQAGIYEIHAWWPSGSNRSSAALFGAKIGGTLYTTTFDQKTDGGRWNKLGNYWMPRGRVYFGLSNDAPAGDVVIGDAMMIQRR